MDRSDRKAELWRRASRIFTEAREVPVAERAEFIVKQSGGDEEVIAEVEALLAIEGDAADFFSGLEGRRSEVLGEPEALVGRALGRYDVVEVVGRGGMGEVYRALDRKLGRRVALKALPAEMARNEEHVARFRREARLIAALSHPNIAGIFDVEEIDGRIFLVLQYVEGRTLKELLAEGPLPLGDVLDIAKQIAGALEAAHREGIVHRDLKPSNIVIASEGRAFVVDFGIAKPLERSAAYADPERLTSPEHGSPVGDLGRTRAGVVAGTAGYMSPEQARGRAVDERSDVWGFGVVLYEMLAGRKAFEGVDAPAALSAVLDSAPDWTRLRPDTPAAVRRLLERCLEPDPRIRLQAIGEARILLDSESRELSDGGRSRPRTDSSSVPVSPPERRRRARTRSPREWAVLTLLLLGIVAAPLLVWSARTPSMAGEILAVGGISDYRDGADGPEAEALSDMLATNLARIEGIAVLSATRLLEVAARDLPREEMLAGAARSAGATALVEGGLHHAARGGYRLDLRLVRVEDGEILAGFALEGPDLFTLADSGTSRIAGRLGGGPPPGSIREVTTASELAYVLYREGLRSYFAGNRTAASSMLDAALREDPGFAMATYWRSRLASDFGESLQLLARADSLAENAPARERWLIRAHLGSVASDPRGRVYADSLVQRFPEDPEGWEFLASFLVADGAYEEALPVLWRTVREIGPDEAPGSVVCRTCRAYAVLTGTYAQMDSSTARRQAAAAWTRDYPQVPEGWRLLAAAASAEGDHEAAESARVRAFELDRDFEADRYTRIVLAYARGDLEAAAAAAGSGSATTPPNWWLASYMERARGRWDAAMDAARRQRALGDTVGLPPGAVPPAALSMAITLRMSGHPLAAAALYDSLAAWRHPAAPPMLTGRQRAWMLLQEADALAMAGDTTRLEALAEEIELLGAGSREVRDRLMHRHVRGLLLLARGDTVGALDQFRRSVYSLSQGYTRTNQVWARVLLDQGDPEGAIPLLQAGLRGNIEGATFHANPMESHDLLARAWDAIPGPEAADSARAHRAWSR